MRRNPNKQKSAFYIAVICQEICVGYEPRHHLIMLAEHKGCPAGSSHPRAWEMTPVPVYVSTLIYLIHTHKKKKGPEDSNNLLMQMIGKVMAENGHRKICNTFCYNITHTPCLFFCLTNPSAFIHCFQLAFKFISTYKENHWYLWKLWLL